MKLEVAGIPYENFLSASAEIRLDALSNTFSFSAVSEDVLPFKGGEPCRVLVDGEAVVTGFIEVVNGSYDSGTHSLSLQGRDKTGDLLDSSIGVLDDLRGKLTLKSVIEKVIAHLKLNIDVIDDALPDKFNPAEDIEAPEEGDNAFEFIEKLARTRQVLLTSNGDGNIVITRAGTTVVNGRIVNQKGNPDNNVISASYSYDTTGRYRFYGSASALNPVALNNAGSTDLAELVNQSGGASDIDIRLGRQFILVSESPYSSGQNDERAKWEANIRKARGRIYSAIINGYRDDDGKLWSVNTLIPVGDSFAGIGAHMLINTIAFTFDKEAGRQTTLSMVNENAYTLTLEEPKTEEIAGGFF